MGVPLDPKNNSRRYWGSPQATEETSWGYRGAPSPHGQLREVSGPPTGPGGKSVGVWGCPLTQGPTHGGIGAAHGFREQFSGSTGVSPDPKTNPRRYRGRPRAPGENLWEYGGVP